MRHIRNRVHHARTSRLPFIGGLIGVAILAGGIALMTTGHFATQRITIVAPAKDHIVVWSFDTLTHLNYRFIIPNDIYIPITSGYGWYKAGALYDLAKQEKKPYLVKNTISYMIGAPVNFVRSSDTNSWFSLLLDPTLGSLRERIVLHSLLHADASTIRDITVRSEDIQSTETVAGQTRVNLVWMRSTTEGTFFEKELRNAGEPLAIQYVKDKRAATVLETILEGSGLNVGYIGKDASVTSCVVSAPAMSKTVSYIATFLTCPISINPHENRILLYLGDTESYWNVP